jgi:Sec-independent protein translocase protein TatA
LNFLGIGGLEFLLIFGVAMFFLGPRRLAEGVRTGRKYYTELRRYRTEMTSLVVEALDAEELKKDLEQLKKDAWDEDVTKEIEGIGSDLALDQGELDIMPSEPVTRSTTKPDLLNRGDGTINGQSVPSMGLKSGASNPAPPEPGEKTSA